jgi:hypothetical protein
MENDCAYLVTDESGWVHCGVYHERPAVCRDFVMGSDACRQMRATEGIEDITTETPGTGPDSFS